MGLTTLQYFESISSIDIIMENTGPHVSLVLLFSTILYEYSKNADVT
jgi:hypothetical protein